MNRRLFADSATASGARWLVISLVLAAVGDLVLDVPYYFGAIIPGLAALSDKSSYRLYASVLSVALPTVIGPIGFVGIFRIERGRGWTRAWRGERARPALFVGTFAAAVRMLIAVYNGWVSNAPADSVRSQVEPLLAPAAFVLAVVSLFGWVAVYDRILGRPAGMRTGGTPQRPLPFSPRS